MSNNEFDRLVADKLKEATFAYEPGDWDRLSVQLAEARRKKRALLFAYTTSGMAAAVFLFLLGISPLLSKKDVIGTTPPHGNTNTAVITAPVHLGYSVDTPSQPAAAMPIASNKKATTKNKTTIPYQAPGNIATQTTRTNNTALPPVIVAAADSGTNVVVAAAKPAMQQRADSVAAKPAYIGLLVPETEEVVTIKKRVSISAGGGVSYGTLNAGYALSAIASKKISKRMDIEVAIGYLNNNGTTITTNVPSGGFTPPINGIRPVSPPTTVSNATPLNYLQFAPVAGYHISDKITIGAGADVQRLLQDAEPLVLYNDQQKLVPLTDFGMLFKTDYSVTKRLKGGLSYRVGVNSIFSNSNYLDRSYMQVLLKYRLH